MSLILPYPGKPANGDSLDASVVQGNIQAVAQAIQSFDASQVSPGTLTAAAFAASINPNTILKETSSPFVFSGCTWSTVSGLQGTMSSGTLYVNGMRVSSGGVGSYNFTASQDTYVDIDYNGNLYYLPVGNGGAAPALTTNAIRLAKVVTNGTAITSIDQFGIDSLGNFLYPTQPGTQRSGGAPNNYWHVLERGLTREYVRFVTGPNLGTPAAGAVGFLVNGLGLPGGITLQNSILGVAVRSDSSGYAIDANIEQTVGANTLNVSYHINSNVSIQNTTVYLRATVVAGLTAW